MIAFLTFIGGVDYCEAHTKSKDQSWYNQDPKGWMWYKQQILPKKKEEIEPEDENSKKAERTVYRKVQDPVGPPNYTQRMKEFQKQFEELQNKAILEPTLDNVQNFQRVQTLIMDRSENFGNMLMLAAQLDSQSYREADQPYPLHRKVYKEKKNQELDRQISAMAKNYGLFFVYKKECPYCHEFSPIVREFIDTYGFEYKAISPDGDPLPEFPDATADNGTISLLNPEGSYPMLFLVNPNESQVIPLSRGLVNITQLRENFEVILQYLADQS